MDIKRLQSVSGDDTGEGEMDGEETELGNSDGDDGWIQDKATTTKPIKLLTTREEKQAKAQRTRDLFLALGRHRPWETGDSKKDASSSGHGSKRPRSGYVLSNDGWIEFGGPASHARPTPPQPPFSFSPFPFPVPPVPALYYSHPPPYQPFPHAQPPYAAYMQMQAYMHMMAQQGLPPPPFPPHYYPIPPSSLQQAVRWS